MNKPLVVLEKERDFTDVINGTFAFITQEFKLLFKVLVLYAGLPIIAASLIGAIYAGNTMSNLFLTIQGKSVPVEPDFSVMGAMYLMVFIAMFMISGLTAAYLDEYRKKGNGGFNEGDVWRNFVSQLLTAIGLNIVTFIMIMIGIVLCIIPGIYIMVPLSLVVTVLYIEKVSFGNIIRRSFELVSNNWWNTFVLIIVVSIIVSVLGGLFSIPAMVIGAVQGFTVATGGEAESVNSVPIIVSTIIGGLGQYLIYPVLYVAVGIQYFNLKEKKDQTSLFKKVSEITNE